MEHFLRMIEVVKQQGIKIGRDLLDIPDSKGVLSTNKHSWPNEQFFELVEKCQPFVFQLTNNTPEYATITNDDGKIINMELDAPFPTFSIEMLDGFISVPELGQDKINTYVNCILAHEIAPKHFLYIVYSTWIHENNKFCECPKCQGKTPLPGHTGEIVFATMCMDGIVERFIKRISLEATGTEHVRRKVKIGTGKNKKHHIIRQIVHVMPKKSKEIAQTLIHRSIDWSHRWLVRGHWRKIDTLGKDREGKYCVNGFTWIKEFEKGPENLPLVKKVRIVNDKTKEAK